MLLKQLHEAKQAPRTYIQVQAGRKVAVGAARALSPQICNLITDPPDQPAAAAETLRTEVTPRDFSPRHFTVYPLRSQPPPRHTLSPPSPPSPPPSRRRRAADHVPHAGKLSRQSIYLTSLSYQWHCGTIILSLMHANLHARRTTRNTCKPAKATPLR